MEGLLDLIKSAIVNTEGKGKDDDVPIMASEGEYVIPAELVAFLGQGNSEAGGKVLDQFLQNLYQMMNTPEG